MRPKSKTKRKPYWWKYYVGECPVCGRDASERVAIYDEPRPEKMEDRYVLIPDRETYDYCDAL